LLLAVTLLVSVATIAGRIPTNLLPSTRAPIGSTAANTAPTATGTAGETTTFTGTGTQNTATATTHTETNSATTTAPPPETTATAVQRPCVGCPNGEICVQFADNVQQQCVEALQFTSRHDVPAISVLRRVEEWLDIRHIGFNRSQVVFGPLPGNTNPLRAAWMISYASDHDPDTAAVILSHFGRAIIDAKFVPYVAANAADLFKEKVWALGFPPDLVRIGQEKAVTDRSTGYVS